MKEFSDSAAGDDRDRTAMLELAAGKDASLNELMERHGPKLYRYLVRSLQNEDDAADIAQETFVRVYRNRAAFDPHQRFSVWLYTIASNLVRSEFRSRVRHPVVSLDAPCGAGDAGLREILPENSPTPRESLENAESSAAVRRGIADLPEELRTPLILSEYEDLSHAEVGLILNCSPKAIETRLYRARRQLREVLSRFLQ